MLELILEKKLERTYKEQNKKYTNHLQSYFKTGREELFDLLERDAGNKFSPKFMKEITSEKLYLQPANKGKITIITTYEQNKEKKYIITIQELRQEHQIIATLKNKYTYIPIHSIIKKAITFKKA